MFNNYFTVALRTLLKHKGYTLIILSGLALGLTPVLMITLYVQSELGYDRFRPHSDHVYRILRETRWPSGRILWSTGQKGSLASGLREDVPEVEGATRFWPVSAWVSAGDKGFDQRFCLADKNILAFFDIRVVKGDPQTVLSEPSSVVLTEEMAQKYFANENPIGKIISVERLYFGKIDLMVTGVLADMPSNSHFKFDFITSTPTSYIRNQQLWDVWKKNGITTKANTYVRLAQGVSPSEVESKIPDLLTKYLGENRGEQEGTVNTYYLQPLKRIHLYSGIDYGFHRGGKGDIYDLYLLIVIALFILIIACTNFMILATARATKRAREIGMRKVLGAHRSQLVTQFLGESILISGVAIFIALLLTTLLLPYFSAFVGRNLSLNLFLNTSVSIWLIGISLFTGIVSGSYPAFFLSGFEPVAVLKGVLRMNASGIWIRKLLVISQFAIATLLITSTFIVYQQLEFMANKTLGFDREQVLVMPIFDNTQLMKVEKSTLPSKYSTVKQEFLKHPNILMATASRGIPGGLRGGSYTPTLRTESGKEIEAHLFDVDEDFVGFFGFRLLAGRGFSSEDINKTSYIITEATAKHLGWENPIGKSLAGMGHLSEGQVVGLIEDFHLDLRHSMDPIVLAPSLVRLRYLSLKVRTEDLSETMDFLKTTWNRFVPDRPLTYFFLDEKIDALYQQEERHGQICGIGAFFAIFVASLGLFGMGSFFAEQKTKEIGVRKVLGASVLDIVILLSKASLKWVAIANAIAWPIVYYLASRWLQSFPYHIDLSFEPFIWGGCAVFSIATATVGYFSIKAATANPIDALRYE